MYNPIILDRSAHALSRKSIDPDALKVLYRLHNHGYKAYLVGGAIRDLLSGRTPKDFDIATNARPGEIKHLFKNSFLIGRRFRLAHIRFKGGKIVEVATFRKESDTESESDIHNTFGTPEEDAFRRDITINALFYDISSYSIIDYVGGLQDLKNNIIRVIGTPEIRFQEDPVRILRVLRHASRLNFAIADRTSQQIFPNRHLLAGCSGARIFEEINKDIASGFFMPILSLMDLYGIPPYIFGKFGTYLQNHPGQTDKLLDILAHVDRKITPKNPLSQEIFFSVLFAPWVLDTIKQVEREGDKSQVLHDTLAESGMQITIPKTLRAKICQILVIVASMQDAIQSGRFRWSLKKRTHYLDAALVFGILHQMDFQTEQDHFAALFQTTHEKPHTTARGKRPYRRRPPRRKA